METIKNIVAPYATEPIFWLMTVVMQIIIVFCYYNVAKKYIKSKNEKKQSIQQDQQERLEKFEFECVVKEHLIMFSMLLLVCLVSPLYWEYGVMVFGQESIRLTSPVPFIGGILGSIMFTAITATDVAVEKGYVILKN